MPSKNDLSSIKAGRGRGQILPSQPPSDSVEKPKAAIGRPPKKKGTTRPHRVPVAFSDEELAILEEKAGLVPNASFLYDFLKRHGLFEKK